MNPSPSSDAPNRGKVTLSYSVAGREPVSGAQPADNAPQLAPLFTAEVASEYRARWNLVQQGFIDDPRRAVSEGDELVTQVMSTLAGTFTQERAALEDRLGATDEGSTEMLRVALRRYRSFFGRLLSV